MKLLVTGATGFLGRFVVEQALARGHRVRALVRRLPDAQRIGWAGHADVELREIDLREPVGLKESLADVDAVVHLAAVLHGDFEAQRIGTIEPTRALLDAMRIAGARRLILVSSLSVYDYRRIPAKSPLDESSPLESRPERREAYARAKLAQEELARAHEGLALTVLRPGAIVGPGRLWPDAAGLRLGRLWLRFTAEGYPLPLTWVGNCAEAVVLAAERPEAVGDTFDVVDTQLPSRREWVAALARRTSPRPWIVALPGAWLRTLAQLLGPIAKRVRLPWLLDYARIDTQLKPLQFSHAKITRRLGWKPRTSLHDALDHSTGRA